MASVSNTLANGMIVVIDKALVDPGSAHLFLVYHVLDPSSNLIIFQRQIEYDRNVAGGETVPQFATRVVTTEKPLRDAAILSRLSQITGSIDVSVQLTPLTQ